MLDADVTIVAACTRDGRGGSPTAVVFTDGDLTEDARREIVRRAGTSHAAFVDTGSDRIPAVRFFTAREELTNCGHGTIAAQAVLLDRRGAAEHRGRLRTPGRTIETTAVRRSGGIEVWFDQGTIELRDRTTTRSDGILAALGLGPGDVAPDDVPRVASPGTPRLLVPVTSRDTLASMTPDFDRLAAACRRLGYLGCFVYVLSPTRETADARMFAPAIGVDEDVVNANSAGCLAAHLRATYRVGSIVVHQGDVLGRPSAVLATATDTADGISTRLGGVTAIQPYPQRGLI